MEVIKCQLNDVVSTPGAKAATGDISNMHLGSDLPEHECVRFRSGLIPQAIKEHHGLQALTAKDGCICTMVEKAWCGLKQAGKMAHDDPVERLGKHGCKKTNVEGHF